MGVLLALTGNTDINKYAIKQFGDKLRENGSYRLFTSTELQETLDMPTEVVCAYTHEFNSLTHVINDCTSRQEIKGRDEDDYFDVIETSSKEPDMMPWFIRDPDNELFVVK